jgi:hypothetical protein
MDAFKIDLFKAERPGEKLPEFRRLGDREADRLRSILSKRAGLIGQMSLLELTKGLFSLSHEVGGIDATEEGFSLTDLMEKLGIEPRKDVYVNWYRYDRIDQIRFEELAKHFASIWYPGPDDIDIFDDSFRWIISVAHNGQVRLTRFSADQAFSG